MAQNNESKKPAVLGKEVMAEKSSAKESEKARIHITGMTCAATIEKGLAETPGVEQAKVNFASEKASLG